MNFWEKSERFSPLLCRLLARKSPHGPALTNDQIGARMGLSSYQVAELSRQLDWRGVDIPTMRRFLEACGTNFENPRVYRRMMVYLWGKKLRGLKIPPPFSYLREHPDWEKVFKPLIVHLRSNVSSTRKTIQG